MAKLFRWLFRIVTGLLLFIVAGLTIVYWMASRSLWNQHTYHITNIEDDGTVPLSEKNNWDSWNNYRFRNRSRGTFPSSLRRQSRRSLLHAARYPRSARVVCQ